MRNILFLFMNLYSFLTLYALQNKEIVQKSVLRSLCGIIGSILITVSSIGLIRSSYIFISLLVSGLLLIHIFAILNGYLLHGKLNYRHHLIRLIISIIIVSCYIFLI